MRILDQVLALIFMAVVLGLIPAAIAHAKGHNFAGFWLYGVLLFIVATPHAILLTPDRLQLDMRKARQGFGRCPACAEMVRHQAQVCRYCRSPLVA